LLAAFSRGRGAVEVSSDSVYIATIHRMGYDSFCREVHTYLLHTHLNNNVCSPRTYFPVAVCWYSVHVGT
jgi:hypothetical protein